ncbi:MAG: hypothetical protein II453_18580, partial [Alphaproteobacteria bacterium]|nr:hypothetical protein [Alphaproteobacteria bacterium]
PRCPGLRPKDKECQQQAETECRQPHSATDWETEAGAAPCTAVHTPTDPKRQTPLPTGGHPLPTWGGTRRADTREQR